MNSASEMLWGALVVLTTLLFLFSLIVYLLVRPVFLWLADGVSKQIGRATGRLVDAAYASPDVATATAAMSARMRRFAASRGTDATVAQAEFLRYRWLEWLPGSWSTVWST